MTDPKSSDQSKKSKKSSPPSTISGPTRAKWGNKVQFILSCVGYSVGLGNVWRFSYLAFENGGGAFLIPYVIGAFLSGLPLYVMELALGQFGSLGPTSVFGRMAPLFQGLGVVCVTFNISLYYNVIIAWILFYLFESLRSKLQWNWCNHDWNTWKCTSAKELEICRSNENLTDSLFFNFRCHNMSELNDTALDRQPLFNGSEIPINITILNTFKWNKESALMSSAEEFYNYYILGMEGDESFGNLGAMNWAMVGCFVLAWALVFACLWGGVQTSGKVVYFTALFPYAVLLIMLIRGSLLPGAGDGIWYYIYPNVTKLKNPQTWREAAVQVFYSLGPAQGGLITLASYNEFDNNFIRDSLIVAVVDSMTSTFAGFTTFSIIGYVAHLLKVDVGKAVKSGPGLAFIVFPQAAASMPGGPFWSILFFLMLLTLGLDSEFVLFETVTTAVMDEFPKLQKHKTAVTAVACVTCFLLGLPFCTRGAIYVFTIYDDYSSGYIVMLLALYQTMVVCWVYVLGRFLKDIERMRGKAPNYYWRVMWAVITPLYMLLLFVVNLVMYEPSRHAGERLEYGAQTLGWFLSSMPMLSILLFAVYRIVQVWRKKLPWVTLITATAHWCPAADLVKRSPARHEGSIRMHLLDHPHRIHPLEGDVTTESQAKSVPSRKSDSTGSSVR